MSDRIPLRFRRLPDGEFRAGYQVGWDGALLEFDPVKPKDRFSIGDLLEIECGSTLYLGQLQQWHESTAVVLVEHSIDQSKLPALEEAWG